MSLLTFTPPDISPISLGGGRWASICMVFGCWPDSNCCHPYLGILCCEKMYKYFLLLLPQEVLILSKNGWKTVENGDFITSTCGNLSLVIACQCTVWPRDWKRRWKGRFFSLPPTFPPVRIVELVEYPEYVERDILLGTENVKNMEIPLIPWNWLCSSKRVLEWAHTGMLCPVLENLPTCLMLR